MADTRGLGWSEKRFIGVGNEKSRDRLDARRQIEGLNLADQQVALLRDIADAARFQAEQQVRTNQLLEWVGGLLNDQLAQAEAHRAQGVPAQPRHAQ